MNNANAINGRLQCFSVSGIDGNTTGSTQIFVPTSQFTPLMLTFEATLVSGFVGVSSCSIGTNGASYNNILAISALTGVIATNNVLSFPLSLPISSVSSGTGIFVNVTIGALGTTYTTKVSIIGFYD